MNRSRIALGVLGAAVMGTRTARSAVREARARAARAVAHAPGRWSGFAYRIGGATPDLMPGDAVLEDRVRSTLGPLLARLDLPHPKVMVVDGVAILHGAVATKRERRAVEAAAGAVAGIDGVDSHLRVGLGAGDTRPSRGRVPQPSEALGRLRSTARLGAPHADEIVGATLSAFLARVPLDERLQVIAHLPRDVRDLLDEAVTSGNLLDLRDPAELVSVVAAMAPGTARRRLERIVPSLVGVLRALVPEEAADVRAVLPEGLRSLWAPSQVG